MDKNKKKSKKEGLYTAIGQVYSLSWRIALTGAIIAGSLAYILNSCDKKQKTSNLEKIQYESSITGGYKGTFVCYDNIIAKEANIQRF